MTILPDGIQAAASQEHSIHPKNAMGKEITAWKRRGATIEATISEVNKLRTQLDAAKVEIAEAKKLLEALKSRPF